MRTSAHEAMSDGSSVLSAECSSCGTELDMDLFLCLPREIQDMVLSHCDQWTLFPYAFLNKDWNRRITPKLWQSVNFASQEDVENSRRFFASCDTLLNDRPNRAKELLSYIESLSVGRLYGLNVLHYAAPYDEFAYWDPPHDEASRLKRHIFDIIAEMPNLKELSIYVKSWWGSPSRSEADPAFRNMRRKLEGLTRLTSLELGGQMSRDVLQGLLHHAENIRQLTLINLHETPGQDYGPEAVTFVDENLAKRFTRLESLSLCKLADLHGRLEDDSESEPDEDDEHSYASGMRWAFPRESETAMLNEWALLIRHTSHTLKELRLENRYLCSNQSFANNDVIELDSTTSSENWGANSIRKSRERLFPLLGNEKLGWENLEKISMIGMGQDESINAALGWLSTEKQVEIVQEPAVITTMGGDATPDDVGTPHEFSVW